MAVEAALLKVSASRLQRLVIAALETGCRQGELLALQWRDVNLKRREIHIRAANAKDALDRMIPISARLLAVLEMAQADPAGGGSGRMPSRSATKSVGAS